MDAQDRAAINVRPCESGIDMKRNINVTDYWNDRFGTGDWANKGGFSQTRHFAEAQISLLNLPSHFGATLCDFGCGAGDAFPVYRAAFPKAKLIGVDFSAEAIRLCKERYGELAPFYCGTVEDVPKVEVVIASNVIEHFEDDMYAVRRLLEVCKSLYVVVPYKEQPLSSEHLRQYHEDSFSMLKPIRHVVFLSRGWSQYDSDLWINVYLRNVARAALGRPLVFRGRQILFEFTGRAKQ